MTEESKMALRAKKVANIIISLCELYKISLQNQKKIAKMVGITIPLTLYVARHSWASAAKTKGVSMSVISEGIGHDRETTTQIYLASLDTSVADKANSLILKSLKSL